MIEIIPNLHPLFVHFTIGLLITSVGLIIASSILSHKPYANIILNGAYINLWIGSFITIATVIAGFDAYNTVNHDTASHLAMQDHRNWALVTFSGFALLTIWSIIRYRKSPPKTKKAKAKGSKANVAFLTLIFLFSLLLLTTAYKGGELVYRYGVGVMSLPKQKILKHDYLKCGHSKHGHSKHDSNSSNKKHDHSKHRH